MASESVEKLSLRYLDPVAKGVYICASCWLLAVESRDLFQAEEKVTIVKDNQIHKIASKYIFHSKWSKVFLLSKNICHSYNLLSFVTIIYFSA